LANYEKILTIALPPHTNTTKNRSKVWTAVTFQRRALSRRSYAQSAPEDYHISNEIQLPQLSQRDRAAGWVSYGQKWKTATGRQYFTDIIGLPSTTVT